MNFFLPVIFVAIALGIFFGFTDPAYTRIKVLRGEEAQYTQALTRSRELQEVRDQLLSRYNVMAQSDIDRLEKLLPDNVDNVRLILDIDSVAAQYGMRTRNVQLEGTDSRVENGQVGKSDSDYQSVVLSFSATASYDVFRSFVEDLEQSLRLVDITKISFSSTGEQNVYDYSVSLKTYWLKP